MATLSCEPRTTAVLFVECQNGLLGDTSKMKSIAEAARPIVPNMGRLARGARDAGVQVVHLTFSPVANNRSSNRRPPLFKRLNDSLADWTADHHDVQTIPSGMSPTYGTETYKLLRNMGIETVVLAGISANVAIPVAATEAADEDFEVVIASDAVAGAPVEHVESMMKYTLPFIATLMTVEGLLAEWGVSA